MAPTTTTTKQLPLELEANKSSLPIPAVPPTCSSSQLQVHGDDDDEVRQLVLGRWRSSLSSGLRVALACTIVGLVSVYAPAALLRHITFPAFSYVVTVIIVTDATVGTALRGAMSALHGTLMGAAPSVVALWLAHCTGAAESVASTSALVALTTFAVALPESVGPVAKRIALGQAIIIYVARFQQGERPSRALALLHPANVVACTALGVAAALLAVLLPWPRLATREARDKRRAYKVVAAERVRVLADAFAVAVAANNNDGADQACSRQRRWQMAACMSESKRLASASTALLNRINAIKEDSQWERAVLVPIMVLDDNKNSSIVEMPLMGMQIALEIMMQQQQADGHGNYNKADVDVVDLVMAMRDQIRLALLTPNNKQTAMLNNKSLINHLLMTRTKLAPQAQLISSSTSYDDNDYDGQQQLAPLLFLFSLYQLHHRCYGGSSDDGPKRSVLLAEAAAAAVPNNNTRKVAPAAQELLLEEQPTDLLPDEELGEEEEVDDEQVRVARQDDNPSQVEAAIAGEAEKASHYCCATKSTTTTTKHHRHQAAAGRRCIWWRRRPQLVAAAKCGFSLGLAVLLGLLFSNDHGFWSGLIVATTMTAGRESTWAVAVARAHGTALGSIYGVLGCLLMSQQQRLLTMDLRFLAILPWMVLATFLKRSCTYGPAGGVAAALSVVIILGRRYDEAPMAFTMARLVETFIGISCAVLADLMFQPATRPTVKAREQLARCVAALADCCLVAAEPSWSEIMKRVQQELALLRKHAAEAGSEPTYLWLPPFPAACYDKIQGSLGRMVQLLQLYHQARRTCISLSSHEHQRQDVVDVAVDDDDINTNQRVVSTSLSHCLRMLAPHKGKPKGQVVDLEAGNDDGVGNSCCCCYKDEEAVASFLARHAGEAKRLLLDMDEDDNVQQQQEVRLLAACCLGSIALCMGKILKEAQLLEEHILELNNLQPMPNSMI